MNGGVIERLQGDDMRIYVVWVPMFRGRESDVPKATTEVMDPRAMHFWDGDSQLVAGYRQTLGFNEPAWDIFLLYGSDAKWENDPTRALLRRVAGSRREVREFFKFAA
jgi:hypothetical protein